MEVEVEVEVRERERVFFRPTKDNIVVGQETSALWRWVFRHMIIFLFFPFLAYSSLFPRRKVTSRRFQSQEMKATKTSESREIT